jgi:hypothetical protein
MPIDALERGWASVLCAFGDLVVTRSRGQSTRTAARRYRATRRALGPLLAAARGSPEALAIAGVLPWLDGWEPTPGLEPTRTDDRRHAGADADVASLRRSVVRRYGRAAASIRIGGETIDRLTALGRLATEPDPVARRRTFEALAPVWRTVDGDGGSDSPYRRLLASTAARWARDGSPIDANAAALGIAPEAVEPMLRSILGAWRRIVGDRAIEPWDYRHACGAAARQLDRLVPIDRLQVLNDHYLASLGVDIEAIGIGYDLFPRPGRPVIPVAFTIGRGSVSDGDGGWRARPPYVFATYAEGGLANLGELLHESGHAVHGAAIRARPAFAELPEDQTAFLEATADVLGWDADEPAWQAHWLGEAASDRDALVHRYGSVMLDVCWALFELELHRDPTRRPNDVWTEITADGLGVVRHPEWSWWAIRAQLIDAPGYLANYAFSAVVAAAIRARLRELRGDWWTGDPGWYRALSEAFFRWGAERRPAELLTGFLGGPVTEGPLLADLGRRSGGETDSSTARLPM